MVGSAKLLPPSASRKRLICSVILERNSCCVRGRSRLVLQCQTSGSAGPMGSVVHWQIQDPLESSRPRAAVVSHTVSHVLFCIFADLCRKQIGMLAFKLAPCYLREIGLVIGLYGFLHSSRKQTHSNKSLFRSSLSYKSCNHTMQ